MEKRGNSTIKNFAETGQKSPVSSTCLNKDFFSDKGVKRRKDATLKIRLQALIQSKGMSEPEFFNSLELSRQYWYYISWGIWPCPIWLKVKIAKALNTDSSAIFLNEHKQSSGASEEALEPEEVKNEQTEI